MPILDPAASLTETLVFDRSGGEVAAAATGIMEGQESGPALCHQPGPWPTRRHLMDDAQPTVPYGYCHCGCGAKTAAWEKSSRRRGRVRGEPRRYIHGHNPTRSVDLTDAWIVDAATGCWLWQRARDRGGYGAMGKSTAHRYVYQLYRGPITDGLHLDHLCRVRHCVNPAHMELVTNAENCRRGANATITKEQAREARRRMSDGLSVSAAAAEYGVTYTVMWMLARGRTWRGI